jgi:hypothetical protein
VAQVERQGERVALHAASPRAGPNSAATSGIALHPYLMVEYGDELPTVPPSTPEATAEDPDHFSGQNHTSCADQ